MRKLKTLKFKQFKKPTVPITEVERAQAAESVYAYQNATSQRKLNNKQKIGIATGLCLLTAGTAVACGFAIEAVQSKLNQTPANQATASTTQTQVAKTPVSASGVAQKR